MAVGRKSENDQIPGVDFWLPVSAGVIWAVGTDHPVSIDLWSRLLGFGAMTGLVAWGGWLAARPPGLRARIDSIYRGFRVLGGLAVSALWRGGWSGLLAAGGLVLANGLFAAGPIIETDAPVVNSYAGSGRRGQGAVSVREPASGEVFRLVATDIEATLTRSGHTRRLKFRRGAFGWLYLVRR